MLTLHALRPRCGEQQRSKIINSIPNKSLVIKLDKEQRIGLVRSGFTSRTIRSTRLGKIALKVEKGYDCMSCGHLPKDLTKLVADGMNFAYDSIWEATRLRYQKSLQRETIQKRLPLKISTGSVTNLYTEGLAYISLLIEYNQERIRDYYLRDDRPFIIQVDGTNEGGKSTLFAIRDSFTGNVLYATKMKSENQKDVKKALLHIEDKFRKPDAVVSDMSSAILAAVRESWDGTVPSQICQFHFLRDLGNDLLGKHYEKVRSEMRRSLISSELNIIRSRMLNHVNDAKTEDHRNAYEEAINMVDWVKDYRSALTGKGTPFDLAAMHYYQRCLQMKKQISKINKKRRKKEVKSALKLITNRLKRIERRPLQKAHAVLKKDYALFNEIREIFDLPEDSKNAPLSNNIQASQGQIEPEVAEKIEHILEKLETLDIHEKSLVEALDRNRYETVITQIKKYKDKLGVTIEWDGKTIQLPRTNNLCEVGFRDLKRQSRRQSGKKNLKQTLDSTPAEVLYFQNLKDPDFHKILFGELPEYEAFHLIDRKLVRDKILQIRTPDTHKVNIKRIRQKIFLDENLRKLMDSA